MTFHQSTDLAHALEHLKSHKALVLAGGTDVFPALGQGQRPASVISVTRIHGLRGISQNGQGIRIGAATTWSDIVASDLPPAFDALKAAAREVGSLQIQNVGTIAGNLCNASPAADGVPPLLALGAQVEVASAARGQRLLQLADFITGVRQTALAEDEIVTAIRVPTPPEGMGSAFEKLGSRRYLVISICMTAANIVLDDQGFIARARVAVGSCSAVAQRLHALEDDVIGKRPAEVDVTPAHLTALSPIDDVRGSAAFRMDAVQEQCRRAIVRAGGA